jgi:hypothetical protein
MRSSYLGFSVRLQLATTLARIPIGNDELVLTLDAHDRLDIRVHTPTGALHFPNKNALTIPDVPKPIAALQGAVRRDAA